MTKKSLVVVGARGFGREVIWLARALPDAWSLLGVLDDDPTVSNEPLCGVPFLGPISAWDQCADAWFVIAVGSPRTRRDITKRMESSGRPRFATLVHPTALMSEYVTLGPGCIVCAGGILTTQVAVGRHAIVNLAATVGHDVTIGDFCTLAPQVSVSGCVVLEPGVELGTGVALTPGVRVGQGSFVCAGAVVAKPLPPNCVAAGSPARRVKTLQPF